MVTPLASVLAGLTKESKCGMLYHRAINTGLPKRARESNRSEMPLAGVYHQCVLLFSGEGAALLGRLVKIS